MRRGALALFAAALAASAAAQIPPSVRIGHDVTPKEAYIGDRIQYTLSVVYSSALKPMPLAIPSALGEFEIVSASTLPVTSPSPEKSALEIRFLLITFSTGVQTIPAVPLRFMTTENAVAEAQSEPVPVTIKSVLAEQGDKGGLRPLEGPF